MMLFIKALLLGAVLVALVAASAASTMVGFMLLHMVFPAVPAIGFFDSVLVLFAIALIISPHMSLWHAER
jgi:hypothetical protein